MEVHCPACEDVDDEADVYAVDGCRAIVSEPLYLDGPRDEDSFLRLERIDTKESKMTWTEKKASVGHEIARHRERWGETFGLRAFPGEKFSIVEGSSFYCALGVLLYTYRCSEKRQEWLSFSKGSPSELHRESVRLG